MVFGLILVPNRENGGKRDSEWCLLDCLVVFGRDSWIKWHGIYGLRDKEIKFIYLPFYAEHFYSLFICFPSKDSKNDDNYNKVKYLVILWPPFLLAFN